MKISGIIAFITGGASGLGLATVQRLHAQGAEVVIFDNDADKAKAVCQDLSQRISYQVTNVADCSSTQAAVNEAIDSIGVPRVLCNFAGVSRVQKLLGKQGVLDMALFQSVIDVNLSGTVNMCRSVIASMAEQPALDGDGQRGIIINTASIAATEGQIGQIPYAASKGGVLAITLPMARELAHFGIRVNCLKPGLIMTPLFETLGDKVIGSLSAQTLFPKRLGQADEVAKTVCFLIENDYVNATTIRIDSGMRMQ